MSRTRTFSGVTAEILIRMKELGRSEYGIVYDCPKGATGIATSQTALGECVIEFVHDREKSELALALLKSPPLLPEGLLWSGFADTLDRCREPPPGRIASASRAGSSDPLAGATSPEPHACETTLQESDMEGDTAATSQADLGEVAMQSVAAAMRDAAKTATEHATKVKQSASEAGPKALETLSRMTYSGSYALAYGLVYATVFVTQSLPQDNPIMRGLADGGRAALDALDGD